MNLFLRIVDLALRVAAFPTTLVVGLVLVGVGFMAWPSGVLLISAPALAVGAWILVCSAQPGEVAKLLPPWASLRFALTKIPVYAMACAGIYWIGNRLLDEHRATQPPPQTLTRGEAEYPATNDSPARIITVSGALPENLPVKDLVAVYTAKVDQENGSRCTRRDNRGPEDSRSMRPLTVIEHVPITRQGGRYEASVVVDRFIPGYCGWQLKQIGYFMAVDGYTYPEFRYGGSPPHVSIIGQDPEARPRAGATALYSGPMDVWCWKTDKSMRLYYPVSCADKSNGIPGRRSEPLNVPDPERDAFGVVYVLPETTSVTFNFHNVGEEAAKPSAIDVAVGDSFGKVRKAFSASVEVTEQQAVSLWMPNKGVRVFFDRSGNVQTIRLDAPFAGAIHEVRIGSRRQDVLQALGPPTRTLPATSSPDQAYLYDTDRASGVRYDFGGDERVATIYVQQGAVPIPATQ